MHSKPAGRPRMSNWSKAAALVANLAFVSPAHAQTQTGLAGQWAFRSEFAAINCTITGQATLTPTAPGRYDVRMTARETCGGADNGVAEEVCVATQTGTRVSVDCDVLRTIPQRRYYPDDFELQWGGGNHMTGLLTANWNAPAEWRRLGPPAVS